MSTFAGRKFRIIRRIDWGHFYGAEVGDIITACDPGFSVNEIWVDPKDNPCIEEEGWKDMQHLCFAFPNEINVYIKEVFE